MACYFIENQNLRKWFKLHGFTLLVMITLLGYKKITNIYHKNFMKIYIYMCVCMYRYIYIYMHKLLLVYSSLFFSTFTLFFICVIKKFHQIYAAWQFVPFSDGRFNCEGTDPELTRNSPWLEKQPKQSKLLQQFPLQRAIYPYHLIK